MRLTELVEPVLSLLRGVVEARVVAHVEPRVRLERVQRVHAVQLDAHRQQLQHRANVQHEPVTCGDIIGSWLLNGQKQLKRQDWETKVW